uniref:Uncharacterized protein n=1 Tax=Cronobacter sp. TaxID=1888169 RepID=A0A6G6AQV6_9ENTR|nr:hypothetical protein [Cronobacter sp.]UFD94838.1 hypothetical protein [Enterobacter hormaechei]
MLLKNHHPLSCRGRGFDVLRGPAERPDGCYLHPFESRSPQGRKPARAMADVRGAVYRVPFTLDS